MTRKLAGANLIQRRSRTRAGCPNLPDPILKGHSGVSSCLADKEKPHQPNSSKEHLSRCSRDQHRVLGFLHAKERLRVSVSLPGNPDQAWGKWRRMLDAKQPRGSPSWSKAPAPILQLPSLSGPGTLQNQILRVGRVNILKGAHPDVSHHTQLFFHAGEIVQDADFTHGRLAGRSQSLRSEKITHPSRWREDLSTSRTTAAQLRKAAGSRTRAFLPWAALGHL